MEKAEQLRDLVRFFAARPDPNDSWRAEVVSSLQCLQKIFQNVLDGNTKDLKLSNPIIDKRIVKPAEVMNTFLRITPFTRKHIVGDNVNEFVFRLVQERAGECQALLETTTMLLKEAGEVDPPNPWWASLTITIRTTLPDGETIIGNFRSSDTIYDVKEWIRRRLPHNKHDISLGDIERSFDDDSESLEALGLHRTRLVLKVDGDFGRKRMEEVESKRKVEAERNREEREKRTAKQQEEKQKAKEQIEQQKLKALQNFQEDRATVAIKAERASKIVASPSSKTQGSTRPIAPTIDE